MLSFKKYLLISLLFSHVYSNIRSEETFYDYVTLGNYSVGYYDTLIFDDQIHYEQYGYKGNAPLFVQVWFPTNGTINNTYMLLGDYRFTNLPSDLVGVYQLLSKQMDQSFIDYGIVYDLETDNPIDYGDLTTEEILTQIKKISTKGLRMSSLPKMNYPVIVYHHGSQGMSDENTIMAEYFASRGYIFISSNYHLPYPNTIYGLLPYQLEKENKHNQSAAKKVIQFAKTITTDSTLFFVGHSWGAQEGWCFLNDESLSSGFVSMETTIEFKTDSLSIKEIWPYVYDAIQIKKNKIAVPILLFAATESNDRFHFFNDAGTQKMIHAAYKKPFAHNSYTSFYMMRYFLNNDIKQPDKALMLTQINGYIAHLNMMFAFFEHIRNKQPFDSTSFSADFYIN